MTEEQRPCWTCKHCTDRFDTAMAHCRISFDAVHGTNSCWSERAFGKCKGKGELWEEYIPPKPVQRVQRLWNWFKGSPFLIVLLTFSLGAMLGAIFL